MFEKLGNSTAAIVVIYFIFLALLFLCQTLVKGALYLYARLKKSDFTGYEILSFLKKNNNLENSKDSKKKFWVISPFYTYKRKSDEFVICNWTYSKESLQSVLQAIQTVVYANEKNNRSISFRWQFIGIGLLSLVPYLVFIAIMLLTFLPGDVDAIGRLSMSRWISVEAISIVGWIVLLADFFWWMYATQQLELEIEEQSKKINNKALNSQIRSYLNICSYIPFSMRTIV